MNTRYNFPETAAFGRILAKNKIYEHAKPNHKIKDLFIREIEKIIWAYKLSPTTTNLPAGDGVQEIQIFNIALKNGVLSHNVLQTIDRAIPSPILFELKYKGKIKYTAAYKKSHETGKNKEMGSSYFQSDWIREDSPISELPVVLNMGALYRAFFKAIIPIPFRKGETLAELILRVDQLQIKERDTDRLKNRIRKEKQFNRRVELNRLLNELKDEIEVLR